ncbi:hypothetical protein R1flu_025532 [Riccia fluitans]|uniref:SEC7 domain-containing protein n=1 Tax=Riccia fluitans TaxID=41844 RepID=A0ABD1XYD4_9MARC
MSPMPPIPGLDNYTTVLDSVVARLIAFTRKRKKNERSSRENEEEEELELLKPSAVICDSNAMAEAGGGFVTRSFERMLKDAPGKKYINLQQALKAYLEREKVEAVEHTPAVPRVPEEQTGSTVTTDDTAPAQENGAENVVSTPSPGEGDDSETKPALSHRRPSTGEGAAATMAEAGHSLQGSEADLVLLPLRLAFETKQPKLVESALDCLHKLISYGHLEGEAGLDGGKNGVMLTEIFNMVCSAADNAADSVVLQVIKVLLTAVASPSFRVHGECLLTSIRTCYNIVVSSKSMVNQATAKATLTQMINIVFKRMESEAQAPEIPGSSEAAQSEKDSDGRPNEPVEDNPSGEKSGEETSTSENPAPAVSLEELQHLAGDADIKGLEAALDKAVRSDGGVKTNEGMDLDSLTLAERDALLVFRTLCKISMKDGTEDMIPKMKLLSLELLQSLLESVGHAFTVNFAFIDSIKAYLCYALLRASVSTDAATYQFACGIFTTLMIRFRESLKGEIGIFFPLIVLRSLDTHDTPINQRNSVLKMLEKICKEPQLLADVFVNYDCDLGVTNLFERMVNSLAKLAQGTPMQDPNTVAQNIAVKASSLQCLVNVLKSLMGYTAKHQLAPAVAVSGLSFTEDPSPGEVASSDSTDSEQKEAKVETQADQVEKAKDYKSKMEVAVSKFNEKPSKCVSYMVENGLCPREPRAIAQFMRTTPGLDKTMIGDYLGQHEEFQLSVMHEYVDSMNFENMKFDQAIREFLKGFRLPGEAQKIDRIMEKFAERYCRDNPSLFKNADTAYVLAYAVIMLNTDAHNPMVRAKMSKADFVRINSSDDAEEHASQEMLEEIYDSIVKDEIKLKDDSLSKSLKQKRDEEEKNRLVNILNLNFAKFRAATDTKSENEEIVKRTQALFKGVKKSVFRKADHLEIARPMLEAVGWPLLAAFSVTMEDSDNKPRVTLCMEGFRMGIHLTRVLGMETMRYAFLTSLVRFTFLHAPKEMRSKNVEALRTLLVLCQSEPDSLQDTWNAVLECVSRLEFITTSPSITATLMLGSNQVSRDALLQSLVELTGKPTEQVFVNSVKLPSEAIVEFFTALCGVSAEELKQVPARVFSLTKLVEISYYNMARIRMVWARIWSVLSVHFVAAGSHQDEKIAMYAIDSLRQLGIKYLERAELANFTFQNDILKPFVILVRNSKSATIRALIVDCIVQMIKSKVGSIKSGWKSVFMVFTTAAYDDTESIADIAFENVEQVILEHFDQVVGDCFMDCVNCLIAFANNKLSPRTSLKAIALLRICEDRLAEGRIPGGSSRPIDESAKGDNEVAEYYWFPMLAGLSDLTSDPRVEVRNCALEVLFDLLKERGHQFSSTFWESVFHRVLFPIFDYVRHAGKDGEKPAASSDQWLRETCIHSLQLLCDLFSSFYKEVSFLLPALLGLLLDCATRPDQTLASISVGALVRLMEVGGHQFDDKDWTTLLDSIRDACYTTQPVELLNPENVLSFGLDYRSGSKKLGVIPTYGFTGEQTPSGTHSEAGVSDGESIDNQENGQYHAGTPSSTSNGDISKFSRREGGEGHALSPEGTDPTPAPETPKDGRSVVGSFFGGQAGRKFMGNVMDTLMLKNLPTFKGKKGASDIPSLNSSPQIIDVDDHGLTDGEEEGPLIASVRSKCVIQLLLLGALDSLQKKHWDRLKPSHQIVIMDILLSMVDFAASYNSDANLRSRMQQVSGDRPPPNLLRQEVEGTQLYLAVLQRACAKPLTSSGQETEPGHRNEEEKLHEEAERRLVTFYGHILKETAILQPAPGEAVQADAHRALSLRSPVTVKVLESISQLEMTMFKKHLPEFYPYFTKLICSDQMDVRRALGNLFKARLINLLE